MFDSLILTNLPKVNISRKGFHMMQMYLEDNESAFAESIRNARTIMESKFKKNKTYLITSSSPSEGKTTVAFNLALSLQKNYKVLLIEADIRRPSVAASYYDFEIDIKKKVEGLEPPNGLGLFLIQQLVDKVEFKKMNGGGHVVQMVLKMEN